MKNLTLILFLFFLTISKAAFAQIVIDTSFEGANAKVISINNSTNTIKIESNLRPGDVYNVVFYFRVSGFDITRPLKIQVKYSQQYFLPVLAAYSYNKTSWYRFEGAISGDSKEFTKTYEQNSVYFSVGYPYTYTDMLDHISSISSSNFLQVSNLAVSPGGRNVKLLKITEPSVSDSGKSLIWVIGRQHAMESHSNYVVKGFIDFMLSNFPPADSLRRKSIIYVVPIMDVDNAATGGTGKDRLPVDFNRDWANPSYWHAVNAVKQKIAETNLHNQLKIFWDSHNPFPGSPDNSERLFLFTLQESGIKSIKLNMFRTLYNQISGYPIDRKPLYATVGQTASRYIDSIYNNTELVLTMETGWVNRTDNTEWTIDSYKNHGKYMAMSMNRYLAQQSIGINDIKQSAVNDISVYPNPFNSSAVITYKLAARSFVTLKLYDISGKEIGVFINKYIPEGVYSYRLNAEGLATGIYYYTFDIKTSKENFSKTGKLIYLK
jgi:hypothetical protein